MVATEQDRQAPGAQFGKHGVVHALVPAHHFGQMAEAVDRLQHRVDRSGNVAAIAHLDAEARDRRGNARHAQGFRPHTRPGPARADVGRCSDQAYALHAHALSFLD